jgi:hypothetical protein
MLYLIFIEVMTDKLRCPHLLKPEVPLSCIMLDLHYSAEQYKGNYEKKGGVKDNVRGKFITSI